MNNVDDYIKNVIGAGDDISHKLAGKFANTLNNSDNVKILKGGMNNIAVLKDLPSDKVVVVHSLAHSMDKDPFRMGCGLVDALYEYADHIGAVPLAMADVIDASEGMWEGGIELIAYGIVNRADYFRLPVMNGELAILGKRVDGLANISGTMLSLIEKDKLPLDSIPGTFNKLGMNFAVFDHKDMAVYMNSDGIGTKTEFYERAKKWELGLYDSVAMKADDTIKIGAMLQVLSDVVEIKGDIPRHQLDITAKKIAKELGISYILQHEDIGSRIMGYKPEVPCYNVSGTAVSLIDEEMLRNPPKPSAGEYLIGISLKPNPRSNGISQKRAIAVEQYGLEWHTGAAHKGLLDHLSTPSTILYGYFRKLLDEGLATSVYHMSGGSHNSKLAKPLAEHDLFVLFEAMFPPSEHDMFFVEKSGSTAEQAYEKWPMGVDGYFTTTNHRKAIDMAREMGLKTLFIGELEKAEDGRTGVLLPETFDGEVYFPGK